MDAIELLDRQHRDVEELFGQLLDQRPGGERKRELFRQLADALSIHAAIEENHFYPSVKTDDTEDLLLESLEEHLAVKRLLADLLKLAIDDEQFDAKLQVLREEVDHHVKEEREELFPRARELLDPDQREAIGELMTASMVELEGKAPRLDVLAQTATAAPLKQPEQATAATSRGTLARLTTPVASLFKLAKSVVKGVADGFRAPPKRRHRHA